MNSLKLQGPIAVDEADQELFGQHTWWREYRRGRVVTGKKGEKGVVGLAAMIMRPQAGDIVLHVNGDFLDFRRENLRCAPRGSRTRVRRSALHGGKQKASEYKGVKRNKYGAFSAQVRYGGATIWLGSHCCELSAAFAYDEYVRAHFAPPLALNFPKVGEFQA
jgi:hypothetical protein